MGRFANKSVAVTGAEGGIGRAIAEMFAAEGAKVAISDLRSPEDTANDIGATAFACDVSDEEAVKTFINAAEKTNGPLDIFVSNAGVGFSDYPPGHAAGASNNAWETSWQVNVMSSVYASRALLPSWIERGSGNFVIVASAAGLLNQIGSASYSATKHAAVGFAEALAISHKDDGISAHVVCPQYVRTNMTKGMSFANNGVNELLEPSDVADALKQAMLEDRFMVLSHPIVADYFKAKAMDYDGWIDGMTKLRSKLSHKDVKL